MKIDIHVGKRVAFKSNNNGWLTGEIYNEKAGISVIGLYIPIKPIGKEYEDQLYWVEVNDIYLEAKPVEDWMRQYGYLMTKEEYIKHVQSEDFDHKLETGYVSDGEYYYYPIGSYNKTWLMKQPFDYIVRSDNG